MVSWPRSVPGRLTPGWGRKPRRWAPTLGALPRPGVEKVDAGAGTSRSLMSYGLSFPPGDGGEGARGQGKLSFKSLSASRNFLWPGSDGCQLSEARVWGDVCSGSRRLEGRRGGGVPSLLLGRWGSRLCPSGPTGRAADRRRVGAGAGRLRPLGPRAPLPPAGTGAGRLALPPAQPLAGRARAAQRPPGAPGRASTWRRAGA